jgi:hypothetical protein
MLKIPVLALAWALSLAACGNDGGTGIGDLQEGRFAGDLNGVVDGRITGDALSGSYAFGYHDLIVLTDYASGVEVTLFHDTDEFTEGRDPIGDAAVFSEDVVAWVELLDTGEEFESVSGTIDIESALANGIDGTAHFTAESTDVPGDVITVDVAFRTFFDGDLNANRTPSFSITRAKAPHR